MTGVIGWVLWLVHAVGGRILLVLIGAKAYTDTENARNYRLATGGLFVGLLIGVILYRWFLDQFLHKLPSPTRRKVISFLVVPAAVVAITFILESIRKSLG